MKPTLGRFKKEPKQVQGAENEPSNLGAGVLAVRVFFCTFWLVAERVDKKPLEKFKMKPTLGRFKKEPKQVPKKALPVSYWKGNFSGAMLVSGRVKLAISNHHLAGGNSNICYFHPDAYFYKWVETTN